MQGRSLVQFETLPYRCKEHQLFEQCSELRLDTRNESHTMVKITVLCQLWEVHFSYER
jgi:hypothetical protein